MVAVPPRLHRPRHALALVRGALRLIAFAFAARAALALVAFANVVPVDLAYTF
jgi:hypothetical protein